VNRADLQELIRNGENSEVEFKRDDVHQDKLASEMAALLNLEGGHILLGVEDNGSIAGLVRPTKEAEEWVMNIAQNNLQPPAILVWQAIKLDDPDKTIGVIRLPANAPDEPYKAKRGASWVTFVRVGTTSREATREQEMRLYQSSNLLHFDLNPVPDTRLEDLNLNLLENYFLIMLNRDAPDVEDLESWQRILLNLDFLKELGGRVFATVGGLLLFGSAPNRRLPQSGITATAFPGTDKDYNTVDEEVIRGPLISSKSKARAFLEKGVIDLCVDFVKRNMGSSAWLESAQRVRKTSLPLDAVREAIVNAVVHRDYTIRGTDIEVSLYRDRLEVISPGRLPNGVTVSKMKEGIRATRNELLKNILRDYDYIEHRGMGVRRRIIEAMREHNGKEPDLIEDDDRFIVRLWK